MKTRKPTVVIVTPEGVGGITSLTTSIYNHWDSRTIELKVFKVPRSSLRGLINYPYALIRFVILQITRNVVLTHVNLSTGGSPIRKFLFIVVSRLFFVPTVLHIHSGKFDLVLSARKTSRLWKAIVEMEFKFANGIIAISQRQLTYFREKLKDQKIHTQYLANAVDVVAGSTQIPRHDKTKTYDFVFVGRISEEKGALVLRDALLELRHMGIRIAFVGSDEVNFWRFPEESKLRNHDIEFYGEVSHDQTIQVISRSKFLVLPSLVENFPIVILEAFSLGLPVIATEVGEIPFIIENNLSGLLVKAGDFTQLAEAIKKYLTNPGLITEHSKNASDRVSRFFDIRDYQNKLLAVYKALGIDLDLS